VGGAVARRQALALSSLSAVEHRREWTNAFAAGSPVARVASGDVHHPPDRKSRARPTVVDGV